ncbi:MAG: hypothetical protein JNJ57_09645 [Saprospiraceae bacterium]|nr:hypothetical protein [Saprospiraceae bacterium]
MEDFMKNLGDSAKEAAEKAVNKFNELKEAASDKFEELSEKAEAMAAEVKQEAAEKLAEAQAAKEKISQHEGGALGYLTDKAKELIGGDTEADNTADTQEEKKDFWQKAQDFTSDKDK